MELVCITILLRAWVKKYLLKNFFFQVSWLYGKIPNMVIVQYTLYAIQCNSFTKKKYFKPKKRGTYLFFCHEKFNYNKWISENRGNLNNIVMRLLKFLTLKTKFSFL